MSQHADILDERESLRSPFFGSLVVHAGMIALPFLFRIYAGYHGRTLGGSQFSWWRSRRHHSGGANSHSIAARADQSGCKRHRVADPVRPGETAAETGVRRQIRDAIALKSRNRAEKDRAPDDAEIQPGP